MHDFTKIVFIFPRDSLFVDMEKIRSLNMRNGYTGLNQGR